MTGAVRHIHAPGSRGGRFYFDTHGNVRYGDNPNLTRKVRRISPKPNAEGGNPLASTMFAPLWDVLRIARVQSPQEIRKFLFDTFWASQGYTDEQKQTRWEEFVQALWDQDAATFQMDEEEAPAGAAVASSQVPAAVARVAAASAGQRTRRMVAAAPPEEPIWDTLIHPGVVEAPKYKALGLKVKYNGRNIALTPKAEEYAVLFARLIPRKDDNLKDIWGVICSNFSQDFGPEIGIPGVDVSRVDFSAVSKKMEQLALEKKKAKKKPTVKPDPKKTPERYAIADGTPHLVGKLTLPGTNIYIGAKADPRVGRIIAARKITNATLNGTKFPRNWHGQTATEKSAQWLVKYENPLTGVAEYIHFAKSSKIKQEVSASVKWEDLKVISDSMPDVRAAYIKGLSSTDPKEREISFLVMLADTMHGRIGKEGRGTSKGLVQLSKEELKADGSYHFYGKDNVLWDSSYKVKMPYTGEWVQMNRAAMQVSGPKGYNARSVYEELARNKGPKDSLFSVDGADVNAWLKKAANNEVITIHKFRHYHGTKYWVSEWDKHKHKLDAMKAKGTLTPAAVREIADHCATVAAVKLGHRRTESAKAKAKRLASEATKRAAGKKVKKKAHGVGSATTRTSYLDFEIILGHTLKYDADVRSATEQRDTAHWLDKKFQKKLDKLRGTKVKTKKAFADLSDLHKGMLLVPVDLREDPNPVIPDPDCRPFSERVMQEVLDEKAEQEWGGEVLAKTLTGKVVLKQTRRGSSRMHPIAEISSNRPGEDLGFTKPRSAPPAFSNDHFAHASHGTYHIKPFGSSGYTLHYYPGGWSPEGAMQPRPDNRHFVDQSGESVGAAHTQPTNWRVPERAIHSSRRDAAIAALKHHNEKKKPGAPAILVRHKKAGEHQLFTDLKADGIIGPTHGGDSGVDKTHRAIREMFADEHMGKEDFLKLWGLPPGFHHVLSSVHADPYSSYGEDNHALVMRGKIHHTASNEYAGEINRRFLSGPDSGRYVYHDSMFMEDTFQDQGFAKHMLGSAYRSYQKHGFNDVKVGTAAVGKYAWAKGGFDFDSGELQSKRYRLRDFLSDPYNLGGLHLPDHEVHKILTGMHHSWDIASLTHDGAKVRDKRWNKDTQEMVTFQSNKIGKRFLLDDYGWDGRVNLREPDGSDPRHEAQHEYLRKIGHL